MPTGFPNNMTAKSGILKIIMWDAGSRYYDSKVGEVNILLEQGAGGNNGRHVANVKVQIVNFNVYSIMKLFDPSFNVENCMLGFCSFLCVL